MRLQFPHLLEEIFHRCKTEDLENSGEISFEWFAMIVEVNAGDDLDMEILNVFYF
jgi:hypothetical protein